MNISKDYQYNQGVGRSKLFSSVAGVGSIVITKFGNSALVLCIEEWGVIQKVNEVIKEVDNDISVEKDNKYYSLKIRLKKEKVNLIEDHRFLEFIKVEQELLNLFALVDVPHLSLSDTFNTIQPENPKRNAWKSDPLLTYYIPSIHFPNYFIGRNKMELRKFNWWKTKWGKRNQKIFAPPRDYSTSKKNGKDEEINPWKFKPLIQHNLVYVCRYGHLSDIPWAKYLRWKNQKLNPDFPKGDGFDDKASTLFAISDCCKKPELFWTENRNTSEGYSNIWLECKNSKCETKKVNLEGINSINPKCPGHKPWTTTTDLDDDYLHRDKYCNCTESRITLISASSIYYSRTFTNIYLPMELARGISEAVGICLERQEKKFNRLAEARGLSREEYAESRITYEDLVDNYEKQIEDNPKFVEEVKKAFLMGGGNATEELERSKIYENYRYEEFNAFSTNLNFSENKKLSFNQIDIPEKLKPFFNVISRVDILAESQIQLGFSRVAPLDSDESENQMPIYRSMKKDVRSLPSIQSLGEGIFFSINEANLTKWISNHPNLTQRLNQVLSLESNMNESIRRKLENFGLKFLVIHSLSHLLMRGLEFKCGYPTSSLKERLYVSDRMDGFLIYTSEGAEGSMGGLVSQTEDNNLVELFDKSFQEAYECSSDPLCWEATNQGVSGLNLAACFSCSLTSETACEEFNLGLDRRVVIDPDFGFFKDYKF